MTELSAEEIEKEKATIDALDREGMCRLWRFAPNKHPYFNFSSPLWAHFQKKWVKEGGFTPEISKKIGWKKP